MPTSSPPERSSKRRSAAPRHHITVLIVSSSESLVRRLTQQTDARLTIHATSTIGEAATMLRRHAITLVLVEFHASHGCALFEQLREHTSLPLLALVWTDADGDAAMDCMGVEDWLLATSTRAELIRQIEQTLKRRANGERARHSLVLVCGALTIDFAARQLVRAGQPIPLSPTEWRILGVLIEHAPVPLNTLQLTELVWGRADAINPSSVREAIKRMRRRIEFDGAQPQYILSAEDGYYFAPVQRQERVAEAGITPFPLSLPRPLTSFIGRTDVLPPLTRLLTNGTTRLITLLGPAGVGKTRLAIQTAQVLAPHFNSTVFVALADLSSGDGVLIRLAQRLGINDTDGATIEARVIAALKERTVLLVLDNAEHLLDATARLVTQLFLALPNLAVLVTSREPLDLYGEQRYEVPPLTLPQGNEHAEGAEAVQLFVERVRLLNPTFALSVNNAITIAAICVGLEGMPLALELAAAQADHLNLEAIRDGLGRRLDLLVTTARNLDARQRTLRGAIEWSYNLLTPDEQQLFRSFGIFATRFTTEAVTAICGQTGQDQSIIAAQLDYLARKHLVVQQPEANGLTYWTMLESIRAYAAHQLDEHHETVILAERRAIYYRDLLTEAEANWFKVETFAWPERVDREYATLASVLQRADAQQDAECLLALVGVLWRYWDSRGYLADGQHWMQRTFEHCRTMRLTPETAAPEQLPLLARALNGMGGLAFVAGEYAQARYAFAVAHAAYERLGDTLGMARTLMNQGSVANHQGDFAAAAQSYGQSLSCYRQFNAPDRMVGILYNLSEIEIAQGADEQARQHLHEVLNLSRHYHYPKFVALADEGLGILAGHEGDMVQAQAHFRASLTTFETLGVVLDICRVQLRLARLASNNEAALVQLRAVLEQCYQHGYTALLFESFEAIALRLMRQAEYTFDNVACQLLVASSSKRAEHALPHTTILSDAAAVVECQHVLAERFGINEWAEYSARGAPLPLAETVRLALHTIDRLVPETRAKL